jgi:hypothetical protein
LAGFHGPGIALNYLLQGSCRGDPGKIGTASGGRQGKAKSNEVMSGISDHRLIQISDLNLDATIRVRQRA